MRPGRAREIIITFLIFWWSSRLHDLGVERLAPGRVRLGLGGRGRAEAVVVTGGTDEVRGSDREAGAGVGPAGTAAVPAGIADTVVTHRTLAGLPAPGLRCDGVRRTPAGHTPRPPHGVGAVEAVQRGDARPL